MSVLLIAATLLFCIPGYPISIKERPSVSEILRSWQPPSELETLYDVYTRNRDSLSGNKSLASHIQALPSYSIKIRKVLTEGNTFARGDWQTPQGLNKLSAWFKMQVLHLASMRGAKFNCDQYQSEATTWLYFLAEMAYTESDAQALLIVARFRKMLLEEIQFAVQSQLWKQCSTEQSVRWWKGQRFPWPLDRVIASELSKHRLNPKEKFWVKKSIAALQKNPHQSFAYWLRSQNIFMSEGLKKIAGAWGSDHVEHMQREIQMHQNILLLIMSYDYETKVGQWPQSQEQLKVQGLISTDLIDPVTRKPQLIQKK
jgi:hypothetical protein